MSLYVYIYNAINDFSILFLFSIYGSEIVVVFNGYSNYKKYIKAMEQLRRTAALSKTYKVCFGEDMVVPITQEKFLSNRNNKKKLINMLIEKLQAVNITTKQARDDADVLIVETAIDESKRQKTAVIIGEDIDLLVILIGRTISHQHEIFFKKVGKGNVKTEIYSSKSFDKYPRSKKHILFLHAISGCDLTYALFRKGKKSFVKTLEKLADEESDSLNILCNFCKKPAVNRRVKCMNCATTFHKSCSIKKTKKCCDKQLYIDEDKQKEIEDIQVPSDDPTMEKSVTLENKLLKEMNRDLRENILLLKEKIGHLEAENFELKVTKNKETDNQKQIVNLQEELINTISENMKTIFKNNFEFITEKINKLDIKINELSKGNAEEKQILSIQKPQTQIRNKSARSAKQINTGTPKQLNTGMSKQLNLETPKQYSSVVKETMSEQLKALEDRQLNIMKDIINLEANECDNKKETITTQQNNENNWQIVQKKKRGYKRNIGQSEDKENNFRGIRPKVWMYIYKVAQETTEEDISNFLKRKTGDKDEDFIVRDLKEQGKLKSYMVAADFKYKDDFYKTSFWPMGVNYRRFDFNRHFEKHKTRNIIFNENEERPESFLGVAN